jgi:hypothetical protein
MTKVCFTVGDLKLALEKVADDLPLSESFCMELGYKSPVGFYSIDEAEEKPDDSFMSVDIYPTPIYTQDQF